MTADQRKTLSSELDQLASDRRKTLFQGAWPPDVLYHYTTAEGLYGILNSNRLHATNCKYLNDISEVKYAAGIVNAALDTHVSQSPSDVWELLKRIGGSSVTDLEGFVGRYVSCFCENGDLLSQWRGYGAKGGGFSVGVNTRDLRIPLDHRTGAHYELRKIEYEPERQSRIITDAVTWICTVFEEMLQRYGNDNAKTLIPVCCAAFQDQIFELLSCFKDPVFQEEQEWRLLAIIEERDEGGLVKYRPRNGLIVPYLELDISELAGVHHGRIPVAAVVCGPTTHPELAHESICRWLYASNYRFVNVCRSRIPLSKYL